MMEWIEGAGFEWVKAAHVIFVIYWMAGLFMLPRYFAYHAETAIGSPESEAWKAREKRLLRIILTPAMIAARPEMLQGAGWLHGKLTLVLLLSGFHGFLAAQTRRFGRDEGLRTSRTWRMLNEIPSLMTILIVVLVVAKPF